MAQSLSNALAARLPGLSNDLSSEILPKHLPISRFTYKVKNGEMVASTGQRLKDLISSMPPNEQAQYLKLEKALIGAQVGTQALVPSLDLMFGFNSAFIYEVTKDGITLSTLTHQGPPAEFNTLIAHLGGGDLFQQGSNGQFTYKMGMIDPSKKIDLNKFEAPNFSESKDRQGEKKLYPAEQVITMPEKHLPDLPSLDHVGRNQNPRFQTFLEPSIKQDAVTKTLTSTKYEYPPTLKFQPSQQIINPQNSSKVVIQDQARMVRQGVVKSGVEQEVKTPIRSTENNFRFDPQHCKEGTVKKKAPNNFFVPETPTQKRISESTRGLYTQSNFFQYSINRNASQTSVIFKATEWRQSPANNHKDTIPAFIQSRQVVPKSDFKPQEYRSSLKTEQPALRFMQNSPTTNTIQSRVPIQSNRPIPPIRNPVTTQSYQVGNSSPKISTEPIVKSQQIRMRLANTPDVNAIRSNARPRIKLLNSNKVKTPGIPENKVKTKKTSKTQVSLKEKLEQLKKKLRASRQNYISEKLRARSQTSLQKQSSKRNSKETGRKPATKTARLTESVRKVARQPVRVSNSRSISAPIIRDKRTRPRIKRSTCKYKGQTIVTVANRMPIKSQIMQPRQSGDLKGLSKRPKVERIRREAHQLPQRLRRLAALQPESKAKFLEPLNKKVVNKELNSKTAKRMRNLSIKYSLQAKQIRRQKKLQLRARKPITKRKSFRRSFLRALFRLLGFSSEASRR